MHVTALPGLFSHRAALALVSVFCFFNPFKYFAFGTLQPLRKKKKKKEEKKKERKKERKRKKSAIKRKWQFKQFICFALRKMFCKLKMRSILNGS